MKRPLIAALFLAGVLTLWATIAGFGLTMQDPATTEALAKVDKCKAEAEVSGTEAQEEIAEIASEARAEILEADKEFAEETAEATTENEPGPSHEAFAENVDRIATEACEEIRAVVDETTAEAKNAQDNDHHQNNQQANVHQSVNQGKHEDNDAASSNHEGNHGGNGHHAGDQHKGNDNHKAVVAKETESDDD